MTGTALALARVFGPLELEKVFQIDLTRDDLHSSFLATVTVYRSELESLLLQVAAKRGGAIFRTDQILARDSPSAQFPRSGSIRQEEARVDARVNFVDWLFGR